MNNMEMARLQLTPLVRGVCEAARLSLPAAPFHETAYRQTQIRNRRPGTSRRLGRQLYTGLRSVYQALRRRQQQQTRRALLTLSDHLLDDIGLARNDVTEQVYADAGRAEPACATGHGAGLAKAQRPRVSALVAPAAANDETVRDAARNAIGAA